MVFGREARQVRDATLPVRYRLHALGSCIQLAQPIGFAATWSYLQAKLDLHWRDPALLLPALELLEAERAAYLAIDADYARLRRQQKAAGQRFPGRDEVTPRSPRRWHGDERTGALYSLRTWRADRTTRKVTDHRCGEVVLTAIDHVLLSPESLGLDVDELQRVLDWARRQIHVIGWERDPSEYQVAGEIHRLLGQLHLIANGPAPIATPWNFAAT